MTFRVGQKVVCVDARPGHFGHGGKLILNAVYTVSSVYVGDGLVTETMLERGVGVQVAEIQPSYVNDYFKSKRFRPLVENKRKTDIGVFQRILDSVKQPERVS